MNKPTMNETSNSLAGPRKGLSEEYPPSGLSMAALIEEAQSLKEVLHDAQGRVKQLLAALKLQRKQSRLMASTLASLKQLQQIQG